MSPRPAPHRADVAAVSFLNAAAQLIDAVLAPSRQQAPASVRKLKYPAALEWLRIEEVIRLAQENGGSGLSRRAFHNRWPTKDDFVRDAIIHAMFYNDDPTANIALRAKDLPALASAYNVSAAIVDLANGLIETLLADPRSFLLLHVGPLLDQHPDLRSAVLADMLANRAPWYDGYSYLLTTMGLTPRPGWTIERIGLALQAMLDGFVFRSRMQHEEMNSCRWQGASLFADTVVNFTLGLIDGDGRGLSSREALDTVVGSLRT